MQLTAVAVLQENTSPSDDEINAAMERNYCRCGCYVRIRTAVAAAAEELATQAAPDLAPTEVQA